MRIFKPNYEILDNLDADAILNKLERIARVCYKSEDKICEGSAERLIRALIKHEHEAMLEHVSFSVKFTVDRGISHEIVRHRIASFAQESTRYCNYSGEGIGVIVPSYLDKGSEYRLWASMCEEAEDAYTALIQSGKTPQEARAVLPTCLKTELVMTANLREWRHFFKLRALGTTGKLHPQMVEVAVPLLKEVQALIPVVFDDLVVKED